MKRLSLILAVVFLASTAFAAKICIDPGHGGSDSGAVGCGLLEKSVNLDIGNRFKVWMDKDNDDGNGGGSWSPMRTRATDVYVSLPDRVNYANNNGADRFLSTHANAFNGAANGIETFCYTSGSSNSFDLRNKVYEEAVAMWPLVRRGTKTATFYVIRYTNMPAELHEAAFIDYCPTDAAYLGSAGHRDNQALSQLYAIQRHYGHAKYTPQTGFNVVLDNTSGYFSASANWATSTNAQQYGTNFRWRSTAATSDPATWIYGIDGDHVLKLYAWWVEGANRAPSAPYVYGHAWGTNTVHVNQRVNGGKWNLIGQNLIAGGLNSFQLSCWTTTGNVVVADAFRYTNQ